MLERGFKSWAERTAENFREEVGINSGEPLNPKELASYVGISLWTPKEVPDIPEEVIAQLLEKDPWSWSAVSLQVNGQKIIIYNPRKSEGRQASDIAHEMAHFILEHDPATLIVSPPLDFAMRSFDAKQEDEANWLAWCLLLPREELLHAVCRGFSMERIAAHYGVTETLVNFRLKKTGVLTQLGRKMSKRTRR